MNQDDIDRAAAWNADANYLPPTALDASETALYAHGMAHAQRLIDALPPYCRNGQASARRDLVLAAMRQPSDYYDDRDRARLAALDAPTGAIAVYGVASVLLVALGIVVWGVRAMLPTLMAK